VKKRRRYLVTAGMLDALLDSVVVSGALRREKFQSLKFPPAVGAGSDRRPPR